MKINLSIIVDAIEMAGEDHDSLLNRKTGDIVYTVDMDEDEREELFLNDDYVMLPNQHDIHEYNIMRDFAEAYPDERKSEGMQIALSGSGAFRRFKDTVRYYGISEEWYAFQLLAYVKFAKEWCEENGVEYEVLP